MNHIAALTTRQKLLFFVLASITFALLGCGGVSTTGLPPPSQEALAPPIAIQIQSAPSGPVQLGQTASFSAVVMNDPNNLGVDWTITCQNVSSCGSFSGSPGAVIHSASGQTITYSAPAALSAEQEHGSVTLTAFATADHTKEMTSAPITFIGYETFLTAGTYVLETNGSDISGNVYQRLGLVVLDGNGDITSGEQTVNYFNKVDPNAPKLTSVRDTRLGGSYSVGFDGRGTMTISTDDMDNQLATETFSIVVLSSSRVLLTKLNDPNESSVGTMDMQTSTAEPANCVQPNSTVNQPQGCGYAFVAGGSDLSGNATGFGGILNVVVNADSSLGIGGPGSDVDQASNDPSFGPGVVHSSFGGSVSGTLSSPDPLSGVFQIKVTTDVGTVEFRAYPLDGIHWKLIETDGKGFTMGDAFGQFDNTNNNTGTFHLRSSFPTGNYVFGLFGRDLSNKPASLAAAGFFAADGGTGQFDTGCLCYLDESQVGNSVQISDLFRAVYAVGPGTDPTLTARTGDQNGIGRFYVPNTNQNVPNFHFAPIPGTPPLGTGPAWIMYATGPNGQGPILMLDADIEPCLFNSANNPCPTKGGGIATGIAYPAAAGASFGGQSLGAAFTQNLQGNVNGALGEFSVDGTGSLSGVVDSSIVPNPPDTSLTGKFQADLNNPGRWTGTLSDDNFISAQCAAGPCGLSMSLFPIDQEQGVFVETDLAKILRIETPQSGDLTYGRYYMRTPVCMQDTSHPVQCP